MGTWFDDLSDGIQSKCLYHFSALVLEALRQKSTGLIGHPNLDFLVTGTDNGYFALYQLAQIGGHPLLLPYPTALHKPTQTIDTDLASYLSSWIQYQTAQAISGCFLSDRYFIIKFVAILHLSLRFSIGIDLEHQIDHPHYNNCPLPFNFTPAHLWVRLQQHAQSISFQGQILAAPCEVQRGANVHRLLSTALPVDEVDPINVDNLLTALSSSSASCSFCHETSHAVDTCPLLQ